jgi:uncharacterized damage-inducible protein DinB
MDKVNVHWLSRLCRRQKSLINHFAMFAAYNRWANEKLYEAASQLCDADYRKNCSVAFESMHGTLNHILVGDTIWMARFQQSQTAISSLNAIQHDEFELLRTARRSMDQDIILYISNLDAHQLNRSFTYNLVSQPGAMTQKLSPALAHLFNHQTHHRGQAHAILTRLTGEAPALDLIYYLRETATSQAL